MLDVHPWIPYIHGVQATFLNYKIVIFSSYHVLNYDFIHKSPWTMILYHVTMKLLLLFNPQCFNSIIYWIKPWFNAIMMNSCYSYKFHDISMIALNHELQVFDKMPTRVIYLLRAFMFWPSSFSVLSVLLFWVLEIVNTQKS